MQSAVNSVSDQGARPAWIRFELVAEENKLETLRQGKWVGRDVEYVFITPAYSRDEVVKEVSAWLEQLDLQVVQERVPRAWRDRYIAEYEAWKKGLELPVDGTPILGWGMISPAQQKMLIGIRIRTVEDLAKINDEGVRSVGMGAVDMKQKAAAWLSQMTDKGPLTVKVSALESENASQKISIDSLTKQVEALMAHVKATQYMGPVAEAEVETVGITAADLMPEPEPVVHAEPIVKRPRGNPNWKKQEASV